MAKELPVCITSIAGLVGKIVTKAWPRKCRLSQRRLLFHLLLHLFLQYNQ